MKRIAVSTKLYTALGTLVATALFGIALGGFSQRELSLELDETIDKSAVKLDLVNSIRARSWEMIAANRGMFIFATFKDPERLADARAEWHRARNRLEELFGQTRPLLVTEAGRQKLQAMENAVHAYEPVALEYMRLCEEGRLGEVASLATRVAAFGHEIDRTGIEFRALQLALLKDLKAKTLRMEWFSKTATFVMVVALFAISLAAAYVVRQVNRTLFGLAGRLRTGSAQLATVAQEIASSSQSTAQGASEQAAALEEASASAEQISAMAQKNAGNSQSAATLVTASERRFGETGEKLERTVAAMNEINTGSRQIEKVMRVIDEIAFQTNILALNAAVEAARAGESGMGFAVVADEVRTLAQRSAAAAKDTETLIQQAIGKSAEGQARVDEVAGAVRSIIEEGRTLKSLVDEVHQSSAEQTRGIEQISRAVTQMEQVTQQTAARAEESASASQQLAQQSASLTEALEELTILLGVATV